jgi:tRNA G46 methylase TrmB
MTTPRRYTETKHDNGERSLSCWFSDEAEELLQKATRLLATNNNDVLRTATALRKANARRAPEEISEAIELALCRQKAARFGEWTARGFFTRQSLEQAAAPPIALYHAEQFRGRRRVLEICAGAGFDTAAIARVAQRVTAIEADERIAAMARQNLALQGVNNVEILCGKAEDICAELDLAQFDGLWSDPSRRESGAGRRIYNPEECSPPLSWLQSLPIQGVCGVKLAPGADCAPAHLAGGAWKRIWIGFDDECREQILWKGARNTPDCSAALIASDKSDTRANVLAQWSADSNTNEGECEPERWNGDNGALCGRYLIEPHAALIRTGKLAYFYAEHNFTLFADRIAYGLAAAPPPESPWYKAFHILEALPFHYSRLRKRLGALGWGTNIEIKKRGFPETPDDVRRKLRLPNGGARGVLFCTRQEHRHWAILAQGFRREPEE